MLHFLAQFIPPPIPTPAIPVPVISDPGDITSVFESLMGSWYSAVWPYAADLFGSLALLEFSLFGWKLWRTYGGDIRNAMMETANQILVVGMFLAFLMNGNVWASDIINMFIDIGKGASGIQSLNPSDVLKQGVVISSTLLTAAKKVGFLTDFATAFPLSIAAIFICLGFLAVCAQFVVTKIQTFIGIGAGVIMLGFGAKKETRPYVERYIQFCVVCGVKLMVMYLLVGGANTIVSSWAAKAQAAGSGSGAVYASLVIMCGAILYAVVCWFCSSMVSALLGGSPNLTHMDAVTFLAPMISTGVAAGLAAAGVGKAAVGAGGAPSQSSATPAAASGGQQAGAGQQQGAAATAGKGGGNGGGFAAAARSAARGGLTAVGAATSAAARMPNDRGAAHPPSFSGFHG